MESEVRSYDLVICGGGLAGLALAQQLHLAGSPASVLVLERLTRPLPEAAFKVGESTIETGAYYYYGVLQLRDYLEAEHLEKLGLRYFYQPGEPFAAREEYGVSRFLPAKSYQIDRGKLESHLRSLVERSGADLREGVRVVDMDIRPGEAHQVTYIENGVTQVVRARWVVDAMGRPRMLQRKFGLARKSPGCFNSCWWRIRGKLSVNDFVPRSAAAWHARVHDDRWQSTNHLMGRGYWVWLIPLAPDNTSVGIVTDEAIHPFSSYNSYEKAIRWLQRHEPIVAQALQGREVLDFLGLKEYSYTSAQVFSADRWACVGISGVFADPYYSVGSNMIGFANGYLQRMMEMDRAGTLTQDYVEFANRYFLSLNDFLTDSIHRGYPYHHIGPLMALKTIWDYYIGWTTTDPQFYHEIYLDPKQSRAFSGAISRATVAQARMLRLFEDWGRREEPTGYRFEFIDYIQDLPSLKRLHVKNLFPKNEDFRKILDNAREAVNRIEELAHVIFFMAVRDALPEKIALLESIGWINIEAISLDAHRWEQDGLFEPKTAARDFQALAREIGQLFEHDPLRRQQGAPVEMHDRVSGEAS